MIISFIDRLMSALNSGEVIGLASGALLGVGLINLLGGIAGFVAFSLMVKSIRISGVWILSGIVFGASGMLYLLMRKE